MKVRPQKKVSSACSHCKQRKRKCSATCPCENCLASDRTCIFEQESDGRRSDSAARVRRELSFIRQVLGSILDKIKQREDGPLRALIAQQRSLDDIADYLLVVRPSTSQRVNDHEAQTCKGSDSTNKHKSLPTSSKTLSSNHRTPFPCPPIRNKSSAVARADSRTGFQDYKLIHPYLTAYQLNASSLASNTPSVTILLMQFQDSCRLALASGIPNEVVLGAETINLDMALGPGPPNHGSPWIPSMWVCELLRKFESLDVFVRLIYVYLINQFLRWNISPTPENYRLLPECMVPTHDQCHVPHHAAIDLCHLPALRDILVQQPQSNDANNDEYIVALQLAGVRTAWTGSWDEAVVSEPQLGYRTLTPQFIKIASRVEEWTAGSALLRRFPNLRGKMRFQEAGSIPIDDRHLHEAMDPHPHSQSYSIP